jgi:hypothetical protein
VEPGQCWPTEAEVLRAAEWEQLYQEKPLAQMIAEAKQNVVQRREGVLAREQEVEENLVRMERQVKQWRERQGAKSQLVEAERERRERVLAELRLEFGYSINPEDKYMKERIGEREKAIIKEEKGQKRAEKGQQFKNKK